MNHKQQAIIAALVLIGSVDAKALKVKAARGGNARLVRSGPVKKQEAGRNQPCPCDSGKKYKKCCGRATT